MAAERVVLAAVAFGAGVMLLRGGLPVLAGALIWAVVFVGAALLLERFVRR